MSDLDKILESGSLEDIDKVLTKIEDGATEEEALAFVASGETIADPDPLADLTPSQSEPDPAAIAPLVDPLEPAPVVEEPPVVLAKDGKNHIPFSVLENERLTNTALKGQLGDQSREIELLKQQLEEANIAPKDLPEKIRYTAEQLKELEDFGDVGLAAGIALQQIAELREQLATAGVQPLTPAPIEAPAATNPYAANPDTLRWAQSDAHWNVVETVNAVLDVDPAWIGKSSEQRIPEIVRRTKLALGEQSSAQTQADIDARAAAALLAARRVAPNSLTDVGGEVPGQTKSVIEQLENASESEIEAFLARATASGKSMDEVLTSILT